MPRRTKAVKLLSKSLNEINQLEIKRKIIDNGTMQRLNIPSEIMALSKLTNNVSIELHIDFEANMVTWKPRIKEAMFVVDTINKD